MRLSEGRPRTNGIMNGKSIPRADIEEPAHKKSHRIDNRNFIGLLRSIATMAIDPEMDNLADDGRFQIFCWGILSVSEMTRADGAGQWGPVVVGIRFI